ncbi:UDP-3-O-(3-hydroxymyristoyl)glucosamine N-acyltransferase [Apibacter adventoris]|uniref:UDP-3-O-acylglucosamine N-acyltransferase n=1 Tax=Apibacter adventoris TaxID=1679466 RepID=A0A2S8AB28_9FLAO|nr:UDP-3-O-(3-hydroxymyristoyl)glucosamine N-acyltransferase [Apibacter adventoris]PQL91764.1 UDP-3-O-(3-hydroxymyristoyl)glucosamine N-acyltransferase [Apibacter adventoris]
MKFSAQQIADLVNGKVIGNPEEMVSYISKIEDGIPGTLTFLGGEKYQEFLKGNKASIILISEKLIPQDISELPTIISVEDAYSAFNQLLRFYNEMKEKKTGVEEPVFISNNVTLGKDLFIGAFAYIASNVKIGNNTKIYPQAYLGDNVVIGENCLIGPGVKIYNDCIIGNNCVIHGGTVIGADGFGFSQSKEGYEKVPQLGNVIIEDDVEIGANCTIDRATIGSTLIKKGVKLDNLIQIAHNVEVGQHTVIASQAGVAGSSKIGQWSMIGGQVGISGHLKVGDNVILQAQSGITNDVDNNERLFGSPAIKYIKYQKSFVYFKQLPEIIKRIEKLEKDSKTQSES